MGNEFERLDKKDVISVHPENFERINVSRTLTVIELIEAVKDYIGSDNTDEKLFAEGVEVEILRPGDVWKKGKIKFYLEFCHDEPKVKETIVNKNLEVNQETSSLDDLRDKLKDIEN
ncbi:KGK domain-containing protein [Anabaena cylindrica UHCC 0172]|uniref:KGK domain-containing protein n=1 Tax=Anabaena cylindrica TaxID=1165 RepID=UPI002B217D25|nr:KGK domain-containing protein [Anabaena cylindrica]MEA5552740.1 KGK domain-containing protein [Anabaena cylindrica UHCC 0172]